MKKKVLHRCLLGAPLGLTLSTAITIIISFFLGDGNFYPVVPDLVTMCGNEINAVTLQAVCSLLNGAAWAGATVIWEMEDWSLTRQTVTHFIVGSVCTFPIAYVMHWMERSIIGALSYFGFFFAIYVIIWVSTFLSMKKKIEKINKRIAE